MLSATFKVGFLQKGQILTLREDFFFTRLEDSCVLARSRGKIKHHIPFLATIKARTNNWDLSNALKEKPINEMIRQSYSVLV
jgi:hypothetical protein